jgi:endonuclease/exonuclease/phosphatase family metal-dependent hydrolase
VTDAAGIRVTLRGPQCRVGRAAALALVAMLAAGCLGHAVRAPAPSPVLVPCSAPDCLRVLSWNLHALPFVTPRPPARLRNVAAKIHEQQPDLVLLQEVWAHAYARQLARDLAGTYQVVTAGGCGRPFPCGGLAVVVRIGSGWVASTGTFVAYEASAPWYRLAEWDGIVKKGMLRVELTRGATTLGVLNTHVQTEYGRSGRDYTDVRRQQLAQLAGTLTSTFGARPVVVGGDLNTSPRERSGLYESHVVPLGDDRTRELRVACGECGTRPAMPRPARWLDYVLTRALPATASAARIENEATDQPFSDHEGVLVRLEPAPTALR